MSWAGVLTEIDAHLVAAGATLSPAVTIVRQGEPDTVNAPQFAYWYGGDRESTTGGNTLNKTNLEELVLIRAYWPGSVRAGALDATIEVRVRAAKAAIRTRLFGDEFLNGNCIGMDIGDTESGWAAVGETVCRTIEIAVWVDLAYEDDIAG